MPGGMEKETQTQAQQQTNMNKQDLKHISLEFESDDFEKNILSRPPGWNEEVIFETQKQTTKTDSNIEGRLFYFCCSCSCLFVLCACLFVHILCACLFVFLCSCLFVQK